MGSDPGDHTVAGNQVAVERTSSGLYMVAAADEMALGDRV